MAYILEPMSLASRGLVSPSASGFCLSPFPLASAGVIVLPVELAAKLADPRTREPWDMDFLRHKYRKEIKKIRERKALEAPPFTPVQVMGPSMGEQLNAELENAETITADIALQRYLEADLEELERRVAVEVLLAAESAKRDKQNIIAAIEAVIRYYY